MNARSALETSGFAILRGVLDVRILDGMRGRALADVQKGTMDDDGLNRGYPIKASEYLALIDSVDAIMVREGIVPERLEDAMLIPKLAGEKRRYWHTDAKPVRAQNGPCSDVFALCYLEDTSIENGCLVVGVADDRFLHAAETEYAERIEGEIPVPVRIGDLIVLDYRWPHGAYANQTEQDRLMIRLQIELKGD